MLLGFASPRRPPFHHILARRTPLPHIQHGSTTFLVPAMRDILKMLNDRAAGDLAELTDDELRSFEALCENWRTHAEAERARRQSLPRPTAAAEETT